jgi:hypothetical protein
MIDNRQLDGQMVRIPTGQDTATTLECNLTIPPKDANGYVVNPDYPECQHIESVCKEHPTISECMTRVSTFQNTSSTTLK